MKKMTFWGRTDFDETLLIECMQGLKTATCTPKVWYDAEPEDSSTVGDYFHVYTKQGLLACLIQITENYIVPFGGISGEIGEKIAKGENSTLTEFINDHILCWKSPLEEQGEIFNNDTLIVVEHFKLVETYIDINTLIQQNQESKAP